MSAAPDKPVKASGTRAPKPKSARRRSRELALQGLYQWLVSKEDTGAIQAQLADLEDYAKADMEHLEALLHSIPRHSETLHAALVDCLDRPLEQLSPVEHAAILIGAFELSAHPEIPYRVVINEAVELTKTFGGTDGFKYVNGVLDKLAPKLRPAEIGSRG
jgi:transcription antitermination protein NusB